MVHFLMASSPSKFHLVETFLRSLEKFGKLDSYAFSLAVTNEKVKPSSYISKRAEVTYSDDHYMLHPPVRWFLEPKSSKTIFVDYDILVCSEVKQFLDYIDDDKIYGLPAKLNHLENKEWKKLGGFAEPYFNYGVLSVPTSFFPEMREHLPALIEKANEHCYSVGKMRYASQIALTLAIQKLKLPWQNLPSHFHHLEFNGKPPKNVVFFHMLESKHNFELQDFTSPFVAEIIGQLNPKHKLL